MRVDDEEGGSSFFFSDRLSAPSETPLSLSLPLRCRLAFLPVYPSQDVGHIPKGALHGT
jgi:hypothetical protein